MSNNSGKEFLIDENEYLRLSNEKEFHELFNSILSFTYSISKAKANNSLLNYADKKNTESDLNALLSATGYKTDAEIKLLFSKISKLRQSLSLKYQLTNSELSQNLISKALVQAMKSGKIKLFVAFREPDCPTDFALAMAACYSAQNFCIQQTGDEYYCVGLWATCAAAAWLAYDTCVGV